MLGRLWSGRKLGDQLETLEKPGRQHRSQDEGRRRQVAIRDPACQPETERRQERTVRSHAIDDRLGRAGRETARLGQHDAQRLAPAELDQHGLAELEIAQPLRHEVGVGPVAARGIDRHLDRPTRAGLRRLGGLRLAPERLGQGHGDRG